MTPAANFLFDTSLNGLFLHFYHNYIIVAAADMSRPAASMLLKENLDPGSEHSADVLSPRKTCGASRFPIWQNSCLQPHSGTLHDKNDSSQQPQRTHVLLPDESHPCPHCPIAGTLPTPVGQQAPPEQL